VCDGELDCLIDTGFQSVEMLFGAAEYHSDEDKTYCRNNHECSDGTQQCPNEWQCLLEEKWNDGNVDCADPDDGEYANDETHVVVCPDDYYKCKDGTCIGKEWICDGESDCLDSDDEANCTSCSGSAFFCGVESGKCLDISDVCDGYADCEEKTDEHDDCGADYNEHHGRYANHRHNTIEVNSTMEYHSRGASMICASDEYHCRNRWRSFGDGPVCLPITQVCDDKTQCPFNDDEFAYPENYHHPRGQVNQVEHTNDGCTNSCANVDSLAGWNCAGDCIPTPDGPTCECPTGLYFDNSVSRMNHINKS